MLVYKYKFILSRYLSWVFLLGFGLAIFQLLAYLLKMKTQLLNNRILQLIFSLVGTAELGFESSVIKNYSAFQYVLCSFEVNLLILLRGFGLFFFFSNDSIVWGLVCSYHLLDPVFGMGCCKVIFHAVAHGHLSPWLPTVLWCSFWSVPADPEGLLLRANSGAATPHTGRNFPLPAGCPCWLRVYDVILPEIHVAATGTVLEAQQSSKTSAFLCLSALDESTRKSWPCSFFTSCGNLAVLQVYS